jgi:histidine triad (HIT) family protein
MSYNHAPEGYKCPICLGIQGIESEDTLLKQADLVYKDELVSVFLNSFWIDTAKGHVIVVPNSHFENIYELPEEVGHRVFEVVKKMCLVMKEAYKCDGITTRQNNEPAGNQHAFHYHHHVYPRYDGDSFNENMTKKSILSEPNERTEYVNKLKTVSEKHLK